MIISLFDSSVSPTITQHYFLIAKATYPALNGGKPASSWYRMAPNAHRSELLVADFSVSSSGETYCAVPTKELARTEMRDDKVWDVNRFFFTYKIHGILQDYECYSIEKMLCCHKWYFWISWVSQSESFKKKVFLHKNKTKTKQNKNNLETKTKQN